MADQAVDPTKSPLENLLNLVKYDNPRLVVNEDLVTVGSFSEYIEEGNYRNTQIEIRPTAKKGYKGSVTVKYLRLKLHPDAEPEVVAAELDLEWPGDQTAWHAEILQELRLVPSEILMFIGGEPYHPTANPIQIPGVIEMRPVPGSILYNDVQTLIEVKLEEVDFDGEGDAFVAIQMSDYDLVEIG